MKEEEEVASCHNYFYGFLVLAKQWPFFTIHYHPELLCLFPSFIHLLYNVFDLCPTYVTTD